ncbi:aminopeptidase [Gorillibacterium massiliense]|uniref:aminopeptidase n=1 Tax=Gorillibacterium massiliense TaxID=1280390 RepID=UPI0004B36734|nr:aminopeptidase [Gorillibacterium massiliense]
MDNFDRNLENYAELAVKIGVNIKKGQTLVINSPIEAAPFVRLAAKKAYEAGALNVHVEWSDDQTALMKYRYAPDEAFTLFPTWRVKGFVELAKQDAAFLYVKVTDPDLLQGIDPERIRVANKTSLEANAEFQPFTRENHNAWTIVAVPTPAWAAKIFPGKAPDDAVELLWEQIFKLTRSDKADPIAAWKEHLGTLQSKQTLLNEKHYTKLHYKGPGTDLTLELPELHQWVCAGEETQKGRAFVANIPTEEVFTSPHRNGTNGYVTSTKPLNYGGNLINNFTLTFKDGAVVDVKAEQGEEVLRNMLKTDEGASRLGEVALVPHQSPISNSNLVFYSTLYDENASCHLAVGSAFPFCMKGGASMSEEERKQNGLNKSMTHVDFMIGSADLDIDGELSDGTREAIFRKGNWVI